MLEGLICTFGKPNAKARGAEGGAGGKINGLLSYKGFVLLPINPRALVAVIEPAPLFPLGIERLKHPSALRSRRRIDGIPLQIGKTARRVAGRRRVLQGILAFGSPRLLWPFLTGVLSAGFWADAWYARNSRKAKQVTINAGYARAEKMHQQNGFFTQTQS